MDGDTEKDMEKKITVLVRILDWVFVPCFLPLPLGEDRGEGEIK